MIIVIGLDTGIKYRHKGYNRYTYKIKTIEKIDIGIKYSHNRYNRGIKYRHNRYNRYRYKI